MSCCNCECKCKCIVAAVIASAIIGVITAFLQFAGVIEVATVFLWVILGVAVVYLAVLAIASALSQNSTCGCLCHILNTLLIGILGTVLFAAILLAVSLAETNPVTAILVGLALFFFSLTLTSTACYIKCLSNCGD